MSSQDRTIAIAGCVQHAWWAHRLAAHGEYRADRLRAAAESVLCTNPDSTLDVFGSLDGIRAGLEITGDLLASRNDKKLDLQESALVTRYAGHLLRLGGALLKHPKTLQNLASGFDTLKEQYLASGQQSLQPDADIDELCKQLATLYVENLSPLTPRIMVQGNGIYLRNELFAAGIRTHLLAAVRAAVLWRQCGGRIWLLMFQRGAYLRQIRQLLSSESI